MARVKAVVAKGGRFIVTTPEGIEFEAGPSMGIRVIGTWDDPEGYEVESGGFDDAIYLSVDQAEGLWSLLRIALERATTLAKRRGVVGLIPE